MLLACENDGEVAADGGVGEVVFVVQAAVHGQGFAEQGFGVVEFPLEKEGVGGVVQGGGEVQVVAGVEAAETVEGGAIGFGDWASRP